MIANVEWTTILHHVVAYFEEKFDLSLVIDQDIVREIEAEAAQTIETFKKNRANVAKIAGSVAFWIRKLKPISHDETSQQKYLAINELVGLYVGIGVCSHYFDDTVRADFSRIDDRVIQDWAYSMRRNSHSPQSTVIAFEIIASDLKAPARVAA